MRRSNTRVTLSRYVIPVSLPRGPQFRYHYVQDSNSGILMCRSIMLVACKTNMKGCKLVNVEFEC